MKSRNVIISLLFVLALLVFTFIKIRYEPKRKLALRRNPSRIDYTTFALCRMDCYQINANIITGVLRNGEINQDKSDLHKRPCPIFTIHSLTKQNMSIWVVVQQCGTVARILDCYDANETVGCNCINDESMPLSFFKNNN